MKDKSSPKDLKKVLLQKIERLEAFEERLGVYFENISIKVSEDFQLTILGEMFSKNGKEIMDNVEITCILYDHDGSILDKSTNYITAEDFFGFEVFEIAFYDDNIAKEVSKIRLYPTK